MTAGDEFRAQVGADLELEDADPVWLKTLDTACAILDVIETLEAQVATDGLTVAGSRGQVTAHPLLAEVRQQRAQLTRTLSVMGLAGHETTSDRQRRNAMKRHHGRQTA